MICDNKQPKNMASFQQTEEQLKRIVSVESLTQHRLNAFRQEYYRQHAALDPTQVLVSIMNYKGKKAVVKSYKEVQGFFHERTAHDFDSYDYDVLKAVRSGDTEALRNLAKRGKNMNCSNKAKESLLHIASRRGKADVVRFLVEEAQVPVNVCDDYGRTPLSDAFWTSEPNFEVVDILVAQCPDLLFVQDMRKHTPLQYAPRQHWKTWVKHLGRTWNRLSPKYIR